MCASAATAAAARAGISDTSFRVYSDLFLTNGTRIGFTALFELRLGADAIWWSFPLSSIVSMLLALCYYHFGNWRSASMASRPDCEQPTLPAEQTECATKPSWVAMQ